MLARLAVRRAGREEGFVLVAALAILVVLLVLGTAAVSATVSGVRTSVRSEDDMQALAGAEAAADMGWNRINLVQIDSLGLSPTAPCLSWSVAGDVTAVAALVFGSEDWCPSVTVPVPDTSSATYQFSELTAGARYIVGAATVGTVTRRVELTLNQSTASTPLFGPYAVQSHASLDFDNGTEVTGAGVRSDGSIELQDTEVPCHVPNGVIMPGPGQTVTETNNASTCSNSTAPATGAIDFPPITVPTSNNDSRICVPTEDPCSGTVTWNPVTLSLNLQNTGDSVTLTGNTYVLCSLTMMNGTLNVKPSNGKPVQIYFLPPTLCTAAGIVLGSTDLDVQNTTAYVNNQTGLGAAGLQIYMDGDNTVFINNSSATTINAVVYAPQGTVSLENSATLKGAVFAEAVTMTAQSLIAYDSTAATVSGGAGSILYDDKQYVECTPQPGLSEAPDDGCP
jgi:hypothetical protein